MSNYLAIATVTAALHQLLNGIGADVSGAVVTTQPPDAVISGAPTDSLNLYLYHVIPNQGYRNLDEPARNSGGTLVNQPQLGLNLNYMITALAADNDDMQAQRILASAMRILHENPVLTRKLITAVSSGPLSGSDLASQVEIVKVTPKALTLEEITKLWSSFFQTNYRISATYEATVVLLDSELAPSTPLPVSQRVLTVLPFQMPMITGIDPQILGYATGAEITITGLNLNADGVGIQFGDTPPPQQPPVAISATQIKVAIPAGLSIAAPSGLPAGLVPVQVVQPLQLGSPPVAHNGFESNVVAFALAPTIDPPASPPPPLSQPWFTATRGQALTVTFKPAVSQEPRVTLLIGDYAIPISQAQLGGAFPSSSLTVTVPNDTPTGNTLLLRLQVDKVASLPIVDTDSKSPTYGQILGPIIQVNP